MCRKLELVWGRDNCALNQDGDLLNTNQFCTQYDSNSHLLLLGFHGAANEGYNSHLLVLVLTMLQSQLYDMDMCTKICRYVVCMHVCVCSICMCTVCGVIQGKPPLIANKIIMQVRHYSLHSPFTLHTQRNTGV